MNNKVKQALLNLYIWPAWGIVTLVSFLVLPPLLLVNLLFIRKPKAKYVRQLIRIHGLVLVKIIPFMAGAKLVDKSGGFQSPVIFVANHCSSVDPYLFGLLPMENAFITSWPFKIPFFSIVMQMAGYIHSEDGWETVLAKSKELLAEGCSIIVWPEGHRSEDGQIKRFKRGAFQIAVQTGVPIVPVCISGTSILFPPEKRLLTPSRVEMTLLPPIDIRPEDKSNEAALLLRDKAKTAIENEYGKQVSGPFSNNKTKFKVSKHRLEQT